MNHAEAPPPQPGQPGQPVRPRKPWTPPLLIAHPSLTALTQAQFSQGIAVDSTDGGPQRAVPCSQGFCP